MLLTRRKIIVGTGASATVILGGCTGLTPAPTINVAERPAPPPPPAEPPQTAAATDTLQPDYAAVYAEMKEAGFTIPRVKLGQVKSAFLRKNVSYETREAPGTIVIDPANHYLYHIEEGGRATRYGVGVGREGFAWSGEATIKSKQEWPDWYPPKEMIERRPELKKDMVELQSGLGMHGGPSNPLGARAMYLWQGDRDTLFRIHGTNEPWTVGQSQSSGCIRMINQDVVDIYEKTPVGARVVVLPIKAAHGASDLGR